MTTYETKFKSYCDRLGKVLEGQSQISYHVGWIECKDEILKLLKDEKKCYLDESDRFVAVPLEIIEKIQNL